MCLPMFGWPCVWPCLAGHVFAHVWLAMCLPCLVDHVSAHVLMAMCLPMFIWPCVCPCLVVHVFKSVFCCLSIFARLIASAFAWHECCLYSCFLFIFIVLILCSGNCWCLNLSGVLHILIFLFLCLPSFIYLHEWAWKLEGFLWPNDWLFTFYVQSFKAIYLYYNCQCLIFRSFLKDI